MNLKEAHERWAQRYPKEEVTLQTIKNWSEKFGFCENTDRIVKSHYIIINDKKFLRFLDNAKEILQESRKRTKAPK